MLRKQEERNSSHYFPHPSSFTTPPPIFLPSPLFVSSRPPPSLSVHLNYSPGCRCPPPPSPLPSPLPPPPHSHRLPLPFSSYPPIAAQNGIELLFPSAAIQLRLGLMRGSSSSPSLSFIIQISLGCCTCPPNSFK